MQRYPIVVLVGTSGGGKTSLLLDMLKRFPKDCAAIKSKVTRAQRNEQDAIFYDFVSPDEFESLVNQGRLFQTANFAGHRYGCDREQTNTVIANKIGLVVLVQQSVADFITAGYKLHLIEIIPQGHKPRAEAERIKDDLARSAVSLEYEDVITNSFTAGGFKQASDHLAMIISKILTESRPSV